MQISVHTAVALINHATLLLCRVCNRYTADEDQSFNINLLLLLVGAATKLWQMIRVCPCVCVWRGDFSAAVRRYGGDI